MPTYIMLTSLTAQGVQTLKANPDRLREVNRDVEELGAKVVHQWATLGPFDFVNVVEAPDAETIARVSVALGARGSAKLQTLTALSIDEFLGSRQPVAATATCAARRALATISSRFTSSVRPSLRSCRNESTNGVTPWPEIPCVGGRGERFLDQRLDVVTPSSGSRASSSAAPPSSQCAAADAGRLLRRVDAGRDRRAAAGAVEERQLVVR